MRAWAVAYPLYLFAVVLIVTGAIVTIVLVQGHRADVAAAAAAGADAVLVGESLVRAHDPAAAVAELLTARARTGGDHA